MCVGVSANTEKEQKQHHQNSPSSERLDSLSLSSLLTYLHSLELEVPEGY